MDTQALKKHFGFEEFRPGQQQVIEQVQAGENTLAIFPTGGGKSLCYQYPAVTRRDGALTVVVSPLIALMRDQVEALQAKGLPAARLDSSCLRREREKILQEIAEQSLALLYISPEGLLDEEVIKVLRGTNLALLAIDEAHCVSEWGHSFRPAYLQLAKLLRRIKPAAVLALTATATTKVAREIRQAFKIQKQREVRTPFHRANLRYRIHPVSDDRRRQRLLELLQQDGRTPAVVYATRREDAEGIASFLCSEGVEARSYHAGMNAEGRAEVQDGFLNHQFPVICATIAFGMGVDMADIRSVVHYHAPKSPEGWMQESGRAGRDGGTAYCELMACGDDRLVLENFVHANFPGQRVIENILQRIFSQGRTAVVSRYDLQTEYDLPEAVVDILLARLEIAAYLKRKARTWKRAQVQLLRNREEVLTAYSGKKRKVLATLLDQKGKLDLIDAAEQADMKLQALNELLEDLAAGGDISLQRTHRLQIYQVKMPGESISSLAGKLHGTFHRHSEQDLERVDAVFRIATTRGCITRALLAHFGEKLEDACGTCSSCLGEKRPRQLPQSEVSPASLDEMERIQDLIADRRAVLSSPERLARFLCGISSPGMLRWRMWRRKEWGMLRRMPFEEVLAITKAQVM